MKWETLSVLDCDVYVFYFCYYKRVLRADFFLLKSDKIIEK